MNLTIEGLIPVPLKDKVKSYQSGIWNADRTFVKGDALFVKAPSGTGKTTLIHMLYGLRKDYEGLLIWDSVVMGGADDETIANLRRNKLSVIFQDMRLFPELTTWENLEIKRCLTNFVSEQTVTDWLERLGIAHKRTSLASTLSYGEQQRVSIIRALLQPFEWLLMDEPFSHLDHANIAKARKLIAEVVQQNNAGLILADLDENNYFAYTETIQL